MTRPAPTAAVAIGRFIRFMFAPAQLRLLAIILAAPPLTAFVGWMVHLVVDHAWPADRAEQQLEILGRAIDIVLIIIGVIIIALAMVKVKATGVGGIGLEVGGDDDHEAGR